MKLALPDNLADDLMPAVQKIVPDAQIVRYSDKGELLGDGRGAEVLLRWFIPTEALGRLMNQLPDLRWFHIPRAGVDNSLIPEVVERDLMITNSAGVHATPISEFVLLFILSHAKRVGDLIKTQAERNWSANRSIALEEIEGKTLLIIGMGQIGKAIAVRASAFGMRVLGSSRSGRSIPGLDRVVGDGEWRELLAEADYVVIAAPLTPQTRGMFGKAELAAMRPGSYLINIARGEITDEAALLDALRNGPIAGAALDVFEQEPLPADSPFWSQPNAFVTPHISWQSPNIRPRTIGLFLDNLKRYAAGESLINIVDKHAGY